MFRSTSACAADANSACCQSCAEPQANPGCGVPADDASCQGSTVHEMEDDSINLRCFEQKRRFGFDLLYPLSRYVRGFSGGLVPDRDEVLVENPLFHRGGIDRSPTLFTFAVLGGVPWQNLATNPREPSDFMSTSELARAGRWPAIVGEPSNYLAPTDPFMRESVEPRSGTSPISAYEIAPADAVQQNPVNGNEFDTLGQDLQYACIFNLPEPKVCDQSAFDAFEGCDCFEDDLGAHRPVCFAPGETTETTTQSFGKAYPSLRPLAVARDLASRSLVGSVCTPNTVEASSWAHAYAPLMSSLLNRVTSTFEER
jgi:hypothetical protein